MSRNCPLCGQKPTSHYDYKYHIPSDKVYLSVDTISYCDKCEFGFSSNLSASDKLHYYYNQVYRSKDHPHFTSRTTPYITDRLLAQLSYISQYCDLNTVISILEIGPGEGGFGALVKQFFPHITIYAIEPDVSTSSLLLDAGYIPCLDTTDLLSKLEGNINLVVSSHSLEHFHDPSDFFAIFNDHPLTKPTHGIFLEVPHCPKEYFINRPYDSPHLLFFSAISLTLLAAKFSYSTSNPLACGNSLSKQFRSMQNSLDFYSTYKPLPSFASNLVSFVKGARLALWSLFKFSRSIRFQNSSIDPASFLYDKKAWQLRAFFIPNTNK